MWEKKSLFSNMILSFLFRYIYYVCIIFIPSVASGAPRARCAIFLVSKLYPIFYTSLTSLSCAPSSTMSLKPPSSDTLPHPLDASCAALMSGVLRDGTRSAVKNARPHHALQTLVMRNRQSVRAGYTGESDIYALDGSGLERQVMEQRFVRDGSIRGYVLHDTVHDRDLIKVHFHGNTDSALDRAFKAFFRSPNPKYDVKNAGLFSHLPFGANLGLIRELFPDNRVFEPNPATLPGVPRLEMQAAAALGQKYWLAVTGVPEPVGEVGSALTARVAARSEVYTTVLRNMGAEEAVLWLAMVIATDMKRQKSVTSKGFQSFGAFI